MKSSKIALAGIVAASLGADPGTDSSGLHSLEPLRWKHRVILVRAHESTEALRAMMEAQSEAIEERHILWFLVAQARLQTNYKGTIGEHFVPAISARFFSTDGPKEVVLVGKDGGVKARADKLNLPTLFSLIDSMPMRQAEMREESE